MTLPFSRSTLYVWGAGIAGVVVMAYATVDVLSKPIETAWLILLALTVISGWATLRIPSMPISFSISDTFSILSALLVGPSAGAITAAVDGLVLSFRMAKDRRSALRVLFNMATPAIATLIAAEAFFALLGVESGSGRPGGDGPLGALRLLAVLTVFGVLSFVLNTGMVAMAISLAQRAPIVAIWREHLSGLWVTYLGGTFAAMLMMFLPRVSPVEVLILLAPLPVLLYVTHRHALGRAEDQIGHLAKMNKVYIAAIEALAQAIDAKDQVTSDHIHRVQENSIRLARRLGVNDELDIQAIKAASLLHDVGKLAVPEHILNKPGRLTPSEFEIMKRHAPVGADILSVIGFPYPVVPIVRHHHENWDGTGYPDGLAGDAIPIGARILQVVDCFDALTSHRPYRPRMEDRDALKILSDRRAIMYDPRVLDAFFELHADHGGDGLVRTHEEPAVADPTAAPVAAANGASDSTTTSAELSLFFEIGRACTEALTVASLGEILWSRLHSSLPAAAFVFFEYDERADALLPCYRAGEPTVGADTRIPIGERLSGWVAATRTGVLNSDARLDVDCELREGTVLRSALAVPITRGQQCLGVLTFYSATSGSFTEQHKRLADAAAYAAGESLARLLTPALVAR